MALLSIVNGPSKFDLMLSLFDGDGTHRRPISIKVVGEGAKAITFNYLVESVGREEGSSESWNLVLCPRGDDPLRLKVNYSTRTRKGHFVK